MLRRVFSYSAVQLAASLLTSGSSFVVGLIVARKIGKQDLGGYSYYLLITSVGQTLFGQALLQGLLKFAADPTHDRGRIAGLGARLFLILAALGGTVALLGGRWLSVPERLGLAAIPFASIITILTGLFRSRLESRREALYVSSLSITITTLTLSFLLLTGDHESPMWGDFAANALIGTIGLALAPRLFGKPFRAMIFEPAPPGYLKELIRFTAPLWIAGALYGVNEQIRQLWVKGNLGFADLGLYFFSLQLYMLVLRPVDILARATLPALATLAAVPEKDEELTRTFGELVRFNAVAFPTLAIGVVSMLPLLIDLFSLDEFRDALPLVLVLALPLPMAGAEFLLDHLSVATKDPVAIRNAMTLGLIATLLVLFVAGPHFGLWAAVGSSFVYILVHGSYYLARLSKTRPREVALARSALLRAFPPYALGLFLAFQLGPFALPLALAAHLGGTWALGLWRRADAAGMMQVILRRA